MSRRIDVLDHGYVSEVESWGSDQRIIEAARMSTDKGFLGWGPRCKTCGSSVGPEPFCRTCDDTCEIVPGDDKLLRYLWTNKHATPFEMAGLVIEVKAPIFVFREWHRHRTQCLGPETMIHFEPPEWKNQRHAVYRMRIEELWKEWQQTDQRSRTQALRLRCLTEDTREIVHTNIVDVIRGEPKPMLRVTTVSGRELTATREHKVFTSTGWLRLGDAVDQGSLLVLEKYKQRRLVPVFEEITDVVDVGLLPTFDLSVEGPWHNFVADGFVVHNSYNEMSGRYVPLPDENYVPTVDRLLLNSKTNKQAGTVAGAAELTPDLAASYREMLAEMYGVQQALYTQALNGGVPKELARVHLPVGRYSRMRASANLRNWLAFLTLRMDSAAQWEIQQFAHAVGELLKVRFPKTWDLFVEGKKA